MPRGRTYAARAKPPRYEWVGQQSGWTAVSATAADTASSQAFVFTAGTSVGAKIRSMSRPTIRRIRGQWSMHFQAATADIDLVATFAIGLATEQAMVAGVASLPDPISEGDYSWMFWDSSSMSNHQAITGVLSFDSGIGGFIRDIDTKAMRKVKSEEEGLFAVLQLFNGGIAIPAGGVQSAFSFRVLLSE